MSAVPFHPLANLFPLIEGDEFTALVSDIQAHGLREPVTLYDGMILDGRNRYRACLEAGVDYRAELYTGADPVAFVISSNLRRRHLNEGQRAMIAAELANMSHGGDRKSDQEANLPLDVESAAAPISQPQAAELLNVSPRAVRDATVVKRHAVPELVEKAKQGGISVSAAAQVARLPEADQRAALERENKLTARKVAQMRQEKAQAKRVENDALKAVVQPVQAAGKYGTIVIDPPWDMQKIERDVRPNQVEFEYPTMTEAELTAFDVAGLADENCHLFCWTTQRFLPSALSLVSAWGFRYVLTMVWHKPGGFQPIGLPQYNCEFVLYGRRGSPKFTDTKAFNCAFSAPRREHSRKPNEFYEVIRRVTDAGRIDVFSREAREGFEQYGNETAKFRGAA